MLKLKLFSAHFILVISCPRYEHKAMMHSPAGHLKPTFHWKKCKGNIHQETVLFIHPSVQPLHRCVAQVLAQKATASLIEMFFFFFVCEWFNLYPWMQRWTVSSVHAHWFSEIFLSPCNNSRYTNVSVFNGEDDGYSIMASALFFAYRDFSRFSKPLML